jgi:hypothetical protein
LMLPQASRPPAPSENETAGRDFIAAGFGFCERQPLSDHSIKAARYTTKYLTGRCWGGHPRRSIPTPTIPDASAHSIAPHDAPDLRFRDASIAARPVAVGAFYQTGRKTISLPL